MTKPILVLALAVATFWPVASVRADDAGGQTLAQFVEGPQRSAANKARDVYRHPLEVLAFFDVQPSSTVVEIQPGGGYWTEILAPLLKQRGRYIAAVRDKSAPNGEGAREAALIAQKVASAPELYGDIVVSEFAGDKFEIAPPASVDVVLTFRNLHNWLKAGDAEGAFRAFYKALKPGGVLGVEDHRAPTDEPQDPQAKSGYVREDYAVELAKKAGFELVGSSEVNANPKDTKHYPQGVWTLPPTFRLKDQDHDKYAAIGESDRFVLKFVKPVTAR